MGITAINGVAITSSLALTSSKANEVEVIQNSTNASFYPTFGSNLPASPGFYTDLYVDSNLSYNPSTNILSTTVTTASRADKIVTQNLPFGGLLHPAFGAWYSSAQGTDLYTDQQFTFNGTNNEVRVGMINLTGSNTAASTADATLTVDASLTQSMHWVASFSTTRALQVSNLTIGRSVRVYIRNTNATARAIQFSGSTTTSYSPINMAVNAGAASATQQTIAGSSGTMMVWIENIANNIIGGIM